jgi:hypothetical protein
MVLIDRRTGTYFLVWLILRVKFKGVILLSKHWFRIYDTCIGWLISLFTIQILTVYYINLFLFQNFVVRREDEREGKADRGRPEKGFSEFALSTSLLMWKMDRDQNVQFWWKADHDLHITLLYITSTCL